MAYIKKTIPFEENNIVKKIRINDNELVLKIKNPVMMCIEYGHVYSQPEVVGFDDSRKVYDYDSVFLFPVIPQYFHAVFEIFPKIIKLLKTGEKFIVGLVLDPEIVEDKNSNRFLKRSNKTNAAHLIEFLRYLRIQYKVFSIEEFQKTKIKYTYLYYDTGLYDHIVDDHRYSYENKTFQVNHFLKVPPTEILLSNLDTLRLLFNDKVKTKYGKVFISRKNAIERKFDEELLLEDFFAKEGFEIYSLEHMSILDQIKVLFSASEIVCLYGSGLVNCTLLNNKSKIFSVIVKDNTDIVDIYTSAFDYYGIKYKIIDVSNSENKIENIIYEYSLWKNL